MTHPIAEALAEIRRRATHLDSTGYITVHEDALAEVMRARDRALDLAVEALRSVVRRAHSEPSSDWDSTLLNMGLILDDGREALGQIAALSATPSQEPPE